MKASIVGVDTAGGTIVGGSQTGFLITSGAGSGPAAVVGDLVASHGTGPHAAATMVEGVAAFTVNGLAVVVEGKLASCGDAATGSGFSVQGT